MVYIEPATRLRTDYNRIADLARSAGRLSRFILQETAQPK